MFRLAVLGSFALTADGVTLIDAGWSRRRASAILKVLALADRHSLHREEVMDLLWPDLVRPGRPPTSCTRTCTGCAALARERGIDASLVTVAGEIVRLDPSVDRRCRSVPPGGPGRPGRTR